MRVAGIDPDTKSITIVILDGTGLESIKRIEAKGRRAEDRFASLVTQTMDYLCELDKTQSWPDWIYVEKPMAGPNHKATIDQSFIVGGLHWVFVTHDAGHSLVDPGTWKKAVLGNGHASKEEIKAWALAHFAGLADDHPQDTYDATCIAAFGTRTGGAT